LKTIVVQSHRSRSLNEWIERCQNSVRAWADFHYFDYRFFGDDLFGYLPSPEVLRRYNTIIASDLARLRCLRALLADYERVIWCDADWFVMDIARFQPWQSSYAVGREIWIDQTHTGQLKAFKKVHNAYLQFERDNTFLDFYIETAEKFLQQNIGGVPNQFIGPKLLTALHNVVGLPVHEQAGMLSPLVAFALLRREGLLSQAEYEGLSGHAFGRVISLYQQRSVQTSRAVNMSASCIEAAGLDSAQILMLCDVLSGGGLSK
jgi:hypothetical protein